MNYIPVHDAGQTINPLKTVKYLIVPRGIATLPWPGRRRFWNVGRPETLFFVDPSVCPSAFPFPASPSQFCATHRGFLRSLTSRRVPLPLDNRRGSQLGINLPAKKGKKGAQSRAHSFLLEWNSAFAISFARRGKIRANSRSKRFSSRHRYSIEDESVLGTVRPSVTCVQHADTQEKLSYDSFLKARGFRILYARKVRMPSTCIS